MATFVLVHGAWHGGWCWRRVAHRLRAAGHEVVTPTLTGLGERAHLAGPDVGLETHIRDIAGVIAYEDAPRVVLVGHSYGGMVVTGAAARLPERVAHLVYLDAFVPEDGQSVLDLLPAERRAPLETLLRDGGQGAQIPPRPLEVFGVTDEADLGWATPKLTGQPLRTFVEPVQLGEGADPAMPKTYILCIGYDGAFAPFAARARTRPGWRFRALATGHDAMITAPEEFGQLLCEAAELLDT